MNVKSPILFYDSECGLCNSFVAWVLKREKTSEMSFAPLQGETAKTVLGYKPDVSSVLFYDGNRITSLSTAVGYVLKRMGSPWAQWGTLLLMIPKGIRDFFYSVMATIRRFTKSECYVPTPSQRVRFLP